MDYILNIENLTVKYGDKVALNDVSVLIKSGNFIGLLGSNGAGKSTFINAITGLQKITKGKITYNDRFLRNKKQPFASLGFSPQTQVMDWYTSVWDNVMIGLKLADKKREEVFALCESALKRVSLLEERERIVDTLSGGQQQRVQIARAIAHQPDIYILDEPTTGLDVETSEALLSYLKDQTALGKTVIVSSHDINLLESFCDEIIFLEHGNMEFFGTVDDFIKDENTYFYVTTEEKIDNEQKKWLANYSFPVEYIDEEHWVICAPQKTKLLEIIKDLSPVFLIKDISVKKNRLRDSYLNKVKKGENNGC